MPEVQDSKKEPGKRHFITEKIVKQPLTKKQMVRRGMLFLLAAALFGGVAGVSFAVSFPFVSERLRETVPTESRISIPKAPILLLFLSVHPLVWRFVTL